MSARGAAGVLALLALLAAPARAGDVGETASFPGGRSLFFAAAANPGAVIYDSGMSAPQSGAWDSVLFQGESAETALAFEASRELPGGGWSTWQPAPVKWFAGGRFWGKAVFQAQAPGRLRLRALDVGGTTTHEVRIYSVETFMANDKERHASSGRTRARAQARDIPRPLVHGRDEWHAAPPHEAYTPHTPYRMTLHHSDTKQTYTLADTLQEVKFIQDFHMNGRGWNDIAYHFLIDAAGNIVEGRPEGVVGSHVENQNTGNIGIVMLGTYHPPKNDPVTKAQLDAFVALGSYLAQKYGINPDMLKGHRDYKSTDCPGDELYALLPQLRARLKAAAGVAAAGREPALAKRLKTPRLGAPDFDAR